MPDYETVNVIAGIIAREMAIPEDRIAIYSQNIPPPQDSGLFVAIDIIEKTVLANNIRYEPRGDDLWQLQTLQVREQIAINVLSIGPEAHERNHEVVLALGGTYAQQLQEKHSLHISRIPTAFTKSPDAGDADAAGVNRYTITIAAQRAHFKESVADSFNQFQPVSIITQPSTRNSTP